MMVKKGRAPRKRAACEDWDSTLRALPAFRRPQLATMQKKVPTGEGWWWFSTSAHVFGSPPSTPEAAADFVLEQSIASRFKPYRKAFLPFGNSPLDHRKPLQAVAFNRANL
jgi:hypothetical protein